MQRDTLHGGHLRLAIRGKDLLSAGDGICATRGHRELSGCPPCTALRRLGPLSLAHKPGKHGGLRPGADPVLPGRLGAAAAAARAVAKAHGSPGAAPAPGPPALCNRSSLATAGGGGGHAASATAATSRGCPCIALILEPAGQLRGSPGSDPPHNVGGSHAYRGEQLRSGDGGAIAVQFDATSQVKVADLHWGDLGRGGKVWSVTLPASSRNHSWQPPGDHSPVFRPQLLSARSCHASHHAVLWHMGDVCVPGRTWCFYVSLAGPGGCVCVPGRTLLHSPPQESPHCAHPSPGSTPCTHPSCSPLTWSRLSHRIFSGFRSLCAIPGGKRANEGKNPPPTRLV